MASIPGRRNAPDCNDTDSDADLQEPDGPHGPAATGKWWFVPDAEIQALISEQSRPGGPTAARPRPGAKTGAGCPPGRGVPGGASPPAGAERDAGLAVAARGPGSKESSKDWRVPDAAIIQLVESLSSPPPPQPRAGCARLLSLAGSATLARAPAPQCNSARQSERTIDIWIYFSDSEDHMRLSVPPSLRLGPPEPGSGACPQAARRAGRLSTPSWRRAESLKGLIEELCEIEVDRQRLFFPYQTALTNDELSLRSYGVGDGDQLKLRILKHGAHSNGSVGSSCELGSRSQRGDRLAGKYSGWSLANSRHIQQCRNPTGEVYMQPKWVTFAPQAKPRVSLAAGCSEISRGIFDSALDQPIYLRDRDDWHMSNVRLRLPVR